MSNLSRNINNAGIARRRVIQEKNRRKIIKWLENRENKSSDEIAALECARKDNKSKLAIIYFFVLAIFLIIMVVIPDNIEENEILLVITMPLIIIASVIIFVKLMSTAERDFTKLVERITKFTDIYINEYVTTFNKPSMFDSDFASNFINYANQNRKEFEENWPQIKPFTLIEKLKQKLWVFVALLLIFGLPIFLIFKDSGLPLQGLIYNQELKRSEYTINEQKYINDNKYIVTIEYTIDEKEYKTDVEVEGNYAWMTYGGLYYKNNHPEKVVYIKDN